MTVSVLALPHGAVGLSPVCDFSDHTHCLFLYIYIYRSINKVISLRNISKVFSHFSYTLMAYVLLYMVN